MAQQVYCSNCGSTTNPKVAGSIIITVILIWFAVVPAVIYEIWRGKNKRCRACSSPSIMPLHSPAAQQAINHQNESLTQKNKQASQALAQESGYWDPQPKVDIEPDIKPPVESFAIDKNIDGGLIEFFGLERWYQAAFNDEQKYRLEKRFGEVSGNKLASGPVRFKFTNTDTLNFLYDIEEKLKPQEYNDLYQLVDEQYKIEAGKFCKIDDDRWINEKYYKSWFALMKPRIDALNKLKADNYFTKGQIDVVDDNNTTQPCLEISGKGFNILNSDLDRTFDQHFLEPISGCRCTVRGYRD